LSLQGVNISRTTVWRVLREAGYRKTKPTRKPGLTQEMRSARLKWALDHKDWTLEDWKNVIWTDETSVPGRKPQWRWTEQTGKLVRSSKGGIDWWRYQSCVLIPKLIPFAKECLQDRPQTVVMEDKAPGHAHQYQNVVYSLSNVERLLWPGNSPDCNCIEPCWFYMKRETTKKGAPQSRTEATRIWLNCWRDLPQAKIQAWIERILIHIPKIIELQGGNEYIEGR
ncbi:uncharacterized protein SETTUDRAFT_56772, partial [Exserohilum turcica Et28A]